MKKVFSLLLILGLASTAWGTHVSAPSPVPVAVPLAAQEAKQLLREFSKAQASELDALKHRQKMELKELGTSQGAQFKDWKAKEGVTRRDFFRDHSKGAERRTYIQDFSVRREALLKFQKDEKERRKREQEVRLKSVKDDQQNKLKEFKEFLNRGERPPAALWSQNN